MIVMLIYFFKERYQNDHEFARWVRMIPALAFVRCDSVVAAFEDLSENEDFPPKRCQF